MTSVDEFLPGFPVALEPGGGPGVTPITALPGTPSTGPFSSSPS